jgi:ketosteroid isomerase-like protein
MEEASPADLARALYAALATGDREQLDALLHPEFTGRTAEGMPFGIGGATAGARSCGISRRAPSRNGFSISPTAACW